MDEEWRAYAERCLEAGRKVLDHARNWQMRTLGNDPKVVALLILIRTPVEFQGGYNTSTTQDGR
jgi:hypothetical protein